MSAPESETVPVRHAATVVLLRDSSTGLEVLLTRRSAQLAFMGDLWVFPGGRLDPSDVTAATTSRVPSTHHEPCGRRLQTPDGDALDPVTALGLHVAGCRETFEECGVLLARRADGSPCDAAQIRRLEGHRREIAASSAAFVDMLEAEDLYLDVARLVYWAHWITPSFETRRFDTRFFAVEVPAGQEASVDRTETTEHAWLTVDAAFAQFKAGAMKLSPPTLATLQDLRSAFARHGSLEAMLAAERKRTVPPILPKWFKSGEQVIIVLPWDPEYPALPGEAAQRLEHYPPYLAELPSRREIRRPPRRNP